MRWPRTCAIAGVKIGMLANRANASAVAEFLDKHKFAHVVLDPVFASHRGQRGVARRRPD